MTGKSEDKPDLRKVRVPQELRDRGVTDIEVVKWVITKGPFVCGSYLQHDVHGEKKVQVFAGFAQHAQEGYWPKKWRLPAAASIDREGLPMLCWREYDADPSEDNANAGINWAPRACFILTAPNGEHPPQFVSLSFDYGLPKFLKTPYVLAGLGLFYALACTLFAAFYYLTSGLPLFAVMERLGGPMFFIAGAIAAGIYGCWVAGYYFGFSLRSALLINALVSHLCWRARRFSGPMSVVPNAYAAPWDALEGFEIKTDPKTSPNAAQRRRIRASFGIAAPEIDIVNGTWHEDDARELLRLLIVTFLQKRKSYQAKIIEDAQHPKTLLLKKLEQERREYQALEWRLKARGVDVNIPRAERKPLAEETPRQDGEQSTAELLEQYDKHFSAFSETLFELSRMNAAQEAGHATAAKDDLL